MQARRVLAGSCLAGLVWSSAARGQVTDAERAAARELFKQGDELQRAGRFSEALDKFQRAQQVFSAPTNLLRVAECKAALGRLVESAEAYREVVRTPLPAGSPPAFQAAVDQARAELGQVEPRVPRLVVQVTPQGVSSPELHIDGQSVPSALIGEAMPLDPGAHKVMVLASGYGASEQQVLLKEHEEKIVSLELKPVTGVTYTAAPAPTAMTGSAPPSEGPPSGTPPPPPPLVETGVPQAPRKSRTGFLFGGHLGLELPGGRLPSDVGPFDTAAVAGGGLAFAVDGGLRFQRQWYLGLTIEHSEFGHGNLNGLDKSITQATANTTLVAAILALIVNPDRTSFYGEIGLGNRWFSYTISDVNGDHRTSTNSGEAMLGVGIWIPAGPKLRLLPKATIGFGSFGTPSGTSSQESATYDFVMLGLAGYFNADL